MLSRGLSRGETLANKAMFSFILREMPFLILLMRNILPIWAGPSVKSKSWFSFFGDGVEDPQQCGQCRVKRVGAEEQPSSQNPPCPCHLHFRASPIWHLAVSHR